MGTNSNRSNDDNISFGLQSPKVGHRNRNNMQQAGSSLPKLENVFTLDKN